MKKATLILTLLLPVFAALAQQADTAKLIVHFKFSHLRDTTQRDKPYTENMVLFAGQNASVYKSYDRKLQQAMMRKQIEEQAAQQKGSGNMRFSITSRAPTSSTEYYQFPAQNKLITKERLITPYLIEDKMPAINWAISSDTLTIGGVHCQKATTHFKGRDYTAWFSPDLPFHTGPWKLNGLPGLIVEAYDKNKEVVFKFDSMEEATPQIKTVTTDAGPTIKLIGMDDDSTDPNVIAIPADAVRTTQKEFEKLREAMRKDPQAFGKAVGNGMGGASFGSSGGGAPGSGPKVQVMMGPQAVINNPLELPEKP
ncbi:GLPGLI family protein [Mucilaginibacter sp. dw_454]|uniref:GLPGLI family protein n=1 Tax=Mucilaginibacter sp. dw_454 TaxID=2720079 RepID=UPI001BD53FF5|nr:GLPGLI family protein [Mucilaginibacter sp. dw_454]